MLSSLYIENIAVIEKASLDFDKGLTVLTGETGAGKSIIIDAINAVLGERTSKELIRTGTDSASVTALFTGVNEKTRVVLKGLNIPCDDGDLQITRNISASRSTSKANGVPITAAMLKEIGVGLISIHGQHDSYDLLSPDIHGRYIDAYGGLGGLLRRYQAEYTRLLAIKKELDKLSMDEEQKSRRIDLLRYQLDEIEEASPKPGEREELIKRRDSIRNGESIVQGVIGARNILNGDGESEGVITAMSAAAEYLENAAKSYGPLSEQAQKLRDIEYALEDVGAEIRDFAESFEFDPSELDDIELRLDLLYRLSLKYGETESEILEFYGRCAEELKNIELSDEKIGLLTDEFNAVKKEAIALAKELSSGRKSAALKFADEVKKQLYFLNMPGMEFSVLQERVSLNNLGCDKIQFLVSANPGEEPKPMSKIASGGELSRIMLAIKTVLSDGDDIGTLIFDEVDTGISGEAAHKVGLKLREAAGQRQVVCITHLAQIAAMADNQMFISKKTDSGRTYTSVKLLQPEERVRELARIIGGDEITPLKLKMAEEMLGKDF